MRETEIESLSYVQAFLYTNQLPDQLPVDFPILVSFRVCSTRSVAMRSPQEWRRRRPVGWWTSGGHAYDASFINVSSKACIETLRAVATEVTPCVF